MSLSPQTQQILTERVAKLPEEVRLLFVHNVLPEVIAEAVKTAQSDMSQTTFIENELIFTLLGYQPVSELEGKIRQTVQNGDKVISTLREKIFVYLAFTTEEPAVSTPQTNTTAPLKPKSKDEDEDFSKDIEETKKALEQIQPVRTMKGDQTHSTGTTTGEQAKKPTTEAVHKTTQADILQPKKDVPEQKNRWTSDSPDPNAK